MIASKNKGVTIPADTKLVAALFNINMTSVVYSSLLGLTRDYMKSIFPPNFFNSEYIQNSIFTVSNKDEYDNSMVKERPSLTIAMRYDHEETTFAGDPFLSNMMVQRGAWLRPHLYRRLAWDRNKMIYITSSTSRAKNVFDFILTLNSEMQAINTIGYLRSRIGENKPVFLNNKIIEVPIPPSLIATIAAAKGMKLSTAVEMTAFNKMISEISGGQITHKLHNSSGKFAYFYKYQTNLLFKVNSFDTVDKEMVDKSVMGSTVKLNVSMEYDNHTNFIVESYQNLPPPSMDFYNLLISDSGTGSLMHSSIQTPISSQLPNGQYAIFSTNIITDINEYLDETEFEPYIDKNSLKYIKYLKEYDATYETLKNNFTVKLYRDGQDLIEGVDFIMDWKNNMKLKILIPRPNYDHRFVIYANISEVADFIDSIDTSSNI